MWCKLVRAGTFGVSLFLLSTGARADDPFASHTQAGPPPPAEDLSLPTLGLTLPAAGGEWSVVAPAAAAQSDVVSLRSDPSITVTFAVSPFKAGCIAGTLTIHVAIAKVTGKAHRVLAPGYLPPSWLALSVEGREGDKNVAHACVDRPDSSQIDATISTAASLRDPALAAPVSKLLAAVAQAAGAKSIALPPPEGSASASIASLGLTVTPGRPGVLWKSRRETTPQGNAMSVVTRSNPLDPFLEAGFMRSPGGCSRFSQVASATLTPSRTPAYAPPALQTGSTYTEVSDKKVRKDYFCAETRGGEAILVETAYQDTLDAEDQADLRALLAAALDRSSSAPSTSTSTSGGSGSGGSTGSFGERHFGLSEVGGGLAVVLRPSVPGGVASGTAVGAYFDVRLSIVDALTDQHGRFRIGDDLGVRLGLGLGLGGTDLWARFRAAIGLQAYYAFSKLFELGARVGAVYEGDTVRDAASKGLYATAKLRIWRLAFEGGGGSSEYVIGKAAILLSNRGVLSPTVGVGFEHLAATDGPTSTNTISLELAAPF